MVYMWSIFCSRSAVGTEVEIRSKLLNYCRFVKARNDQKSAPRALRRVEFRGLMKNRIVIRGLLLVSVLVLPVIFASGATIAPPKKAHSKSHHVTESPATQKKMARMKHSSRTSASNNRSTHVATANAGKNGKKKKKSKNKYYERFYADSFANDQVEGDNPTGEDPVVRAAAIDALG